MDTKKVGAFLKKLRNEKELTQIELAEQLKCTHQAVSKWEKGLSMPDVTTLTALAHFYHITIDEVIQGGEVTKIKKKNNVKQLLLFNVSQLFLGMMVILSFLFYYFSETIHIKSNFIQKINESISVKITDLTYFYHGYNVLLNTSNLSLFTSGIWLIFITSLLIIAIRGKAIYDLLKFNKTKIRVMKIILSSLLGLLIVGFGFILLGFIMNSNVHISTGYIIGSSLTVILLIINLLEWLLVNEVKQ